MATAWRIVKRKHAKTAFNGEGARLFGGRWNNPGVPMVYTAESRSLAVLEVLVHLDSPDLLTKYVVLEVTIAEPLIRRVDWQDLPKNWRADPAPSRLRAMGDAWVRQASSAALQVPSAVVPAESLFLLNPRHPEFAKLEIGKPIHFPFDPRLRAAV